MAKEGAGSNKLLLITMVTLVVISMGVAAFALYLVMGDREGRETVEVYVMPERQAPIFVTIDPFTVNLADDAMGSRLLYTGITLMVNDKESQDILQEHMPQVRSRLIMLFTGKRASELTQPGGKEALADAVVEMLARPLTEHQPELQVREVLFTNFIVQ